MTTTVYLHLHAVSQTFKDYNITLFWLELIDWNMFNDTTVVLRYQPRYLSPTPPRNHNLLPVENACRGPQGHECAKASVPNVGLSRPIGRRIVNMEPTPLRWPEQSPFSKSSSSTAWISCPRSHFWPFYIKLRCSWSNWEYFWVTLFCHQKLFMMVLLVVTIIQELFGLQWTCLRGQNTFNLKECGPIFLNKTSHHRLVWVMDQNQ